jgi:YD repeat-containing protein
VTRLAVVLAACGAPVTPIDRPPPPRGDVASACPLQVYPDQVWAHEVFPACPEMPFTAERLPVCAGACPHPCRAITGARSFAISYDTQGRWIESRLESSTDTSDLLSVRCSYDGDRMATCTRRYVGNIEWTDKLERDDRGRLIRVVNDQEQIEIRRDATGRTIAIVDPHADVHFAYDDHGRILREQIGERIVNYGYAGEHWVERRDDVALEELHYTGDRLASVAIRGHGGARSEVHFGYDAERVRTVTRGDDTTSYQYECH